MHALILGLAAALSWGVHDLCVRFVSQRTGIIPALFTALFTGSILVGAAALIWGDWDGMTGPAFGLSLLSGVFFAAAGYALYRAFSIGPVKLVAPLIGSYPILSIAMALFQDQPVSALNWFAVLLVVAGAGCVAVFAAKEEDVHQNALTAIAWSLAAAFGFALTFAVGQSATQAGAELPVLIVTRAAALLATGLYAVFRRIVPLPPMDMLPALCLMGALDALALGLVLIAGTLPRPEFASITSSLFGLITVVLAWLFLRERMTRLQWLSVVVTFCGIACLGL
ncbi:hypothetical protein AB838_03705 [Rhodobacteraceae bacterium (ex Bugula neritina AB1)]|nr:hypothetical protein AB838_03705 [Rhodobacteraceae bacterium (ex Bugula neritina AB1)]